MRCKKCNYRLWNLTSRQCPECGTSFLPSDFEFIPNTIQFCCPHCNQAYYGTGQKGHLVPIEYDCGSCGKHIHMDEMVLLPTAGIEEEETRVDRAPWLERKRRGVIRAWFSTIGMAMVNPGRLVRGVGGESDVGEAWWFAVVTNTLILLMGLTPIVLFPVGMGIAAGGGAVLATLGGLALGVVIGAAVVAIGTVFFIALWGAITHALLRLTGETVGHYRGTCQALCYSSGANVLTALPCLGMYFGWIWWVVSAVLMVKEAQQVQGWRAALAVLTFPVVLILAFVTLYVGVIVMAMSSVGPFAPNLAMLSTETHTVLGAVLEYAEDHEGRGPGHAIQLVSGDYLVTADLVSMESDTYESNIPVGDTTLDQFTSLPTRLRDQHVQAAINALPEGTIAHRLGDFVFTHHDINLPRSGLAADPDPGLWVVVMTPDPGVNVFPSFGRRILVGLADGTVFSTPIDVLPVRLAEQNDLRAKHGLPPLPDPTTVTHDKPATAGRQ